MRCVGVLHFLIAVHGLVGQTLPGLSGQTLKDKLVQKARSYLADFPGAYNQHEEKDGVRVYLSAVDKMCGGTPAPVFATVMEVAEARPIDVFNIMADQLKQPTWLCQDCYIEWLKNQCDQQVRGFYSVFAAAPLKDRSFFTWQFISENSDNMSDFFVGVSNQDVDILRPLRKEMENTVPGDMCMAFTHITATPTGTRLVQISHANVHCSFISPRSAWTFVWPQFAARAKRIREHVLSPCVAAMDAVDLDVPYWMRKPPLDGTCNVPIWKNGLRVMMKGSVNMTGDASASDEGFEGNRDSIFGYSPLFFGIVSGTATFCFCGCLAGLVWSCVRPAKVVARSSTDSLLFANAGDESETEYTDESEYSFG